MASATLNRYPVKMRLLVLITFFTLLAAPVAADERAVFYGTWGTAEQCSRAPIKPGGSVRAEPFVIDGEWLRQGWFWCSLAWGPMERRANGYFTGAHARCNEDDVRGYFLGLILSGDHLTLRWDFPHSNGPLVRCLGE